MPTWHPTPGGAHGSASPTEDVRMGTVRKSMQGNALLSRDELGKVKKTLFHNPPDDHVFGLNLAKDAEGAREVTMIWKPHEPSASPAAARGQVEKPQPDFQTMNKAAVVNGATTVKDQQDFRDRNGTVVKASASPRSTKVVSPPPPPDGGFGKPSSHRSSEVVRLCGNVEPPMKHIVQGAYQEDWIKQNMSRDAHKVEQPYIPPVPTKATMGHTLGAQRYLSAEGNDDAWKLSKFKTVPPRVTTGMAGPNLYSSMRGVVASPRDIVGNVAAAPAAAPPSPSAAGSPRPA